MYKIQSEWFVVKCAVLEKLTTARTACATGFGEVNVNLLSAAFIAFSKRDVFQRKDVDCPVRSWLGGESNA